MQMALPISSIDLSASFFRSSMFDFAFRWRITWPSVQNLLITDQAYAVNVTELSRQRSQYKRSFNNLTPATLAVTQHEEWICALEQWVKEQQIRRVGWKI